MLVGNSLVFEDWQDLDSRWGEWPSGLRRCDKNWKAPGSNSTRRSAGLKDPTSLQGSRLPLCRNCTNAIINMGLVRLSLREWPKVDRGTAK